MTRCKTGWRITKRNPNEAPPWVGTTHLWVAENPRGLSFSCRTWDAALSKVLDDIRREKAKQSKAAVQG